VVFCSKKTYFIQKIYIWWRQRVKIFADGLDTLIVIGVVIFLAINRLKFLSSELRSPKHFAVCQETIFYKESLFGYTILSVHLVNWISNRMQVSLNIRCIEWFLRASFFCCSRYLNSAYFPLIFWTSLVWIRSWLVWLWRFYESIFAVNTANSSVAFLRELASEEKHHNCLKKCFLQCSKNA